jgi:predicted helicase
MQLSQYIQQINQRLAEGHTSEHSFRADLEALIRTLLPGHNVINEPSQITDCGNPDYVITKKAIPIGYIEAKDIGKDLNHKQYKEQFSRYRNALDNLIITDYIWFQFYENATMVAEIKLGKYVASHDPANYVSTHNVSTKSAQIISDVSQFEKFNNLIQAFADKISQSIKSPVKLAELMAGKARLLENILEEALLKDIANEVHSELTNQLDSFRQMLIHDLQPKQFADLYAQTLAYGMFAARYHDDSLDSFDRDEAARLIPKSNPLLRNLFQSIAGYNIDPRIKTTVDNLADVFRHADVKSILQSYGKATAQTDPIIHFYETFLAKYDPALRKARGVWYTPQPVVNFIVFAVDEILKTRFNIKDGLADNSKISIEVEASDLQSQNSQLKKRNGKLYGAKDIHKVQILDPATGTGTFLAQVVNHLYQTRFQHMQGIWPDYVEKDLIPRLNGFELLMASYAMAHLKLDMLFAETGCEHREQNQRLRVFLTNSLEEYHQDTHTLFSQWLSNEAKEANAVKKDTPVMVVMGNPPYSGESANKGKWIMQLMDDYKKEPGGREKLKERNAKWINDDYVKFMRFAQHFIEKNGEGVLAFINPHGFLDNPTFRGMRWNLLKTFDEIYTIDLHGNAKKKETCPDGSKDENIFDIEQGVSINIFVKNGSQINKQGAIKEADLGQIYHFDLYGKRKDKYAFLENTAFKDVPYQQIPNVAPMYFMVPKDFGLQAEYDKGVAVPTIFPVNSVGIVTARDAFTIKETPEEVRQTINRFLELDDETARVEFELGKDVRDWKIQFAKKDIVESGNDDKNIVSITYRPFDSRFTYFTGKSKGFHCMPRGTVMKHMLGDRNIGLCFNRRIEQKRDFADIFIFDELIQHHSLSIKEVNYLAPLYLYPKDSSERIPNLNPEEIKAFEKALNLPFIAENPENNFVPSCLRDSSFPRSRVGMHTGANGKHDTHSHAGAWERELRELENPPTAFTPIDILDFIYAILHSPNYRKTYQEFLKTDFPRVPYPSPDSFWQLVALGDELRLLHLMQSATLDTHIISYPQTGDNIISRKISKTSPGYEASSDSFGKVWINDAQYFENVPAVAWNFYIGGYQPAQKWLKDRKGRKLNIDDIMHYQKIIKALVQTDSLMKQIDDILKQNLNAD